MKTFRSYTHTYVCVRVCVLIFLVVVFHVTQINAHFSSWKMSTINNAANKCSECNGNLYQHNFVLANRINSAGEGVGAGAGAVAGGQKSSLGTLI